MKYLLILFSSLSILGCNNDDDSFSATCGDGSEIDFVGCYDPLSDPSANEEWAYDLVGGQIEFDTTASPGYSIQDGSKAIFVYRHVSGINNEWIDDEFSERLLFEVENETESFTIESQADFEASNCTYGVCGAWYSNTMFQSFEGSISGDKISSCEWNIEVDLIVDRFGSDRHTIQFSEVFSN